MAHARFNPPFLLQKGWACKLLLCRLGVIAVFLWQALVILGRPSLTVVSMRKSVQHLSSDGTRLSNITPASAVVASLNDMQW